MLNHPWHAPPQPAGASRVQPLSPQVCPHPHPPNTPWCRLLAFTGGRSACSSPTNHTNPHSQQPVMLVCACAIWECLCTHRPHGNRCNARVRRSIVWGNRGLSPCVNYSSLQDQMPHLVLIITFRALPGQSGVIAQCADQSQSPVFTAGDSPSSQRQPFALHLPGGRSHALRAPSHQGHCDHTQTRKPGESVGLWMIESGSKQQQRFISRSLLL